MHQVLQTYCDTFSEFFPDELVAEPLAFFSSKLLFFTAFDTSQHTEKTGGKGSRIS